MDYANSNCAIRRECPMETVAGAAAVSAKFSVFQKSKLVAVHAVVSVAGTSAGAGNSLVITHGTTAIGTFTLGTSTAGASFSLTGTNLNRTLASFDRVTATNGTDATGRAIVIYEYQVLPDATQSANA